MAIIRPFAALRPRPDRAAQICELPYDVMSSEEARQIAESVDLQVLLDKIRAALAALSSERSAAA